MRIILARIHWIQGRTREAYQVLAEALDLSEADMGYVQCQVLGMVACPLAIWSGDTVLAEERVEKLRVLSTRHALGYWQTWGEAFHLVLNQKLDIETFKPGSKLHDLVVTMSPLSVDKSLLDRTESGTVRWCSAEHMRAYGEKLLAETGDAQAAETYFRRALTIAQEQGECAWELRAAISLANLNIGRDRADDAGAPLMQACNQFADGLLTQDLVNAKALLSQLGLVA